MPFKTLEERRKYQREWYQRRKHLPGVREGYSRRGREHYARMKASDPTFMERRAAENREYRKRRKRRDIQAKLEANGFGGWS